MDQIPRLFPKIPGARSLDTVWLIAVAGYVALDALLIYYFVKFDWASLFNRTGDTPNYWNAVHRHVRWCQVMMIQPIVVLLLGIVCAVLIGGRVNLGSRVIGFVAIVTIGFANCFFLWQIALGVGV